MQKWHKGVFYPLLNTGVPGALGREIIGVPERSLPGSRPGLCSEQSRDGSIPVAPFPLFPLPPFPAQPFQAPEEGEAAQSQPGRSSDSPGTHL